MRHAYELAVLSALLTLLFAPVHHRAAAPVNVRRTLSGNRVTISVSPEQSRDLRVGDRLPIYRYNPDWKAELGRARVLSVSGGEAVLGYEPADFDWPMGRQGTITGFAGPSSVVIDMGASLGLRPGDRLILFSDRRRVGQVVLTRVGAEESLAEVESAPPVAERLGLTASEFTVPTIAVPPPGPWVARVELALIALLLSAWLGGVCAGRSVFMAARAVLARLPRPRLPPALAAVWTAAGERLAYRPAARPAWLNWLLHLVIAFAFGRTLWGFLRADAAEVLRLVHAARIERPETFFLLARYGLWSLTIVGCLIGYGHTVVSILWKRSIRNLDFTLTGWAVNASCYPLLGVFIVRALPPLSGVEPSVAAGPWSLLMLCTELLLNLLYTLSVWNLGTLFGVMTDKGVRTTGLYAVVRHPSYTLEALMFLMLELRGFNAASNWLAGLLLYGALYWLRSERDDHFMARSNPEYLVYRKAVPWKYLPGLV